MFFIISSSNVCSTVIGEKVKINHGLVLKLFEHNKVVEAILIKYFIKLKICNPNIYDKSKVGNWWGVRGLPCCCYNNFDWTGDWFYNPSHNFILSIGEPIICVCLKKGSKVTKKKTLSWLNITLICILNSEIKWMWYIRILEKLKCYQLLIIF